MFKCDKCGLCCKRVGRSEIYSSLNRGDGVCKYWDCTTRLCTIYEHRPIICNVDKMYDEVFKYQMTREEFYNLNYKACNKMKLEVRKGDYAMYLSILENKEKEKFLKIAYVLVGIDGDFSYNERIMMDSYCKEMQISVDIENLQGSEADALENICEIFNKEKGKIVVFELIGLAMADGNFDENERAYISKISKKLDIPEEFGKECESILTSYFEIQNSLNNLILN